jgi:hypothetical protein
MESSEEFKAEARFQKAYIAILGILHDVAKANGYALGIHGTLGRDLDLIAVPWVEEAESHDKLVRDMARAIDGKIYSIITIKKDGQNVESPNPVYMPHGRVAWVINMGGGAYIDVSVTSRTVE